MLKTIFKSAIFLSLLFSLLSLTNVLAQEKYILNGEEVPGEQVTRAVGKFIGGFFLLFVLAAVVGILAAIFWLVMLIHAATKPIENKAVWIIVMVLTGIVGAIIYYFAVKRKFQAPVVQPQAPTQTPPMQ